jgi:hypothetical protein
MKMEKFTEEMVKHAVANHMQQFVFTIQEALKDFLRPLDPSEGEEEMKYIRSVIESVDNVVATALMVKDDPVAQEALKVSTDMMIQSLIDLHNKKETKH